MGDPHPFVDPESWAAWLDLLLLSAQAKLENERLGSQLADSKLYSICQAAKTRRA